MLRRLAGKAWAKKKERKKEKEREREGEGEPDKGGARGKQKQLRFVRQLLKRVESEALRAIVRCGIAYSEMSGSYRVEERC